MRKIWQYLQLHVREDFHGFQYSCTLLFLALCIYLNFTLDFEDSFLDTQPVPQRFTFYLLTHCVAYLIPVALYAHFKRAKVFKSTKFWIRSMLALTLLSLDRATPFIYELVSEAVHPEAQFWAFKIANNALGLFTLILPLFLFYGFTDRSEKHRYGLNSVSFDFTPYFLMLLVMLPLIVGASFLPGFLNQYPMYEKSNAHDLLHVPEWVTVAAYELAYGLNFVSIEFFYRGFLVIGMISVLGRGAVLCMASLYCFLHFGKPLGEAISSIFGGFILGAIAYQTRSIWGGVIVHIGIAWAMELVAFVRESIRN